MSLFRFAITSSGTPWLMSCTSLINSNICIYSMHLQIGICCFPKMKCQEPKVTYQKEPPILAGRSQLHTLLF
ncbi:Os10g0558725 [Oryza sativa Japonica Group]|uniref:Os10g0558725 protein n=1 Tax=Oryza sativa subsp. japonica TaxID=39947 RepID=A0A0P0XX43_ORYSJ|nr:hypothetical protein EE612_052742 [Oryza sativa]BAT12024.1 Os10g0558725 [Oryza sativa Japonica Group]